MKQQSLIKTFITFTLVVSSLFMEFVILLFPVDNNKNNLVICFNRVPLRQQKRVKLQKIFNKTIYYLFIV